MQIEQIDKDAAGLMALEFLIWQYDRNGPLAECAEAWEAVRQLATLSARPAVGEDVVERVTKAIYDELEGPVNNQDYGRQMRQWELAQTLARAAITAITGGNA